MVRPKLKSPYTIAEKIVAKRKKELLIESAHHDTIVSAIQHAGVRKEQLHLLTDDDG